MILRTPFWVAIAAVLGTAQVTGAVNVFTTAASVLTGIDGAVHTALDFKEWAPQVRTYIKGKKNAASSNSRVLLATKPNNKQNARSIPKRSVGAIDNRGSERGSSYPEKTLSIAEQ